MAARYRRPVRGEPRGSSVDFKIIGLSALAAVLIAGVAWAAWYALEHQPLELDARGCPPGPSRGGLVVVLDLTDAIDPAQMRRVRAEIARSLPTEVLYALAARELAGKLDRIDHLTISPELLGPMLANLVEAGTRRLEG